MLDIGTVFCYTVSIVSNNAYYTKREYIMTMDFTSDMPMRQIHRDVIFHRILELTGHQPETVTIDDVKNQFANWMGISMGDARYNEDGILIVFKTARVKKLNYKLIGDQLVRKDCV